MRLFSVATSKSLFLEVLIVIGIIFILIVVAMNSFLGNNSEKALTGEIISETIQEEIENFTYEIEEKEINSSYPHFYTKTITFSMKGLEAPLKRERMYNALKELETEVGEFNFVEIENYEKANIKIEFPKANNLPTIGEALPRYDKNGDIIGGKITIIKIKDDCDYHATEMHELLHIFGFKHKSGGLMDEYKKEEHCYNLKTTNPTYIEHLQFIYSNGLKGIEHPELPMYEHDDFSYSCDEGLYLVAHSDYCCPEPNMIIDKDGYCAYR